MTSPHHHDLEMFVKRLHVRLFRIHGRKRSGILRRLIVTTFFARMTFVVPCAKKIQLHGEDLAGR
jgi:hypothetical protein